MTPTVPPELPPLPECEYDYINTYYEGWVAVGAAPQDRYLRIDLFIVEQMREYGQQCYEAGMERAAQVCENYYGELTVHCGDPSGDMYAMLIRQAATSKETP